MDMIFKAKDGKVFTMKPSGFIGDFNKAMEKWKSQDNEVIFEVNGVEYKKRYSDMSSVEFILNTK